MPLTEDRDEIALAHGAELTWEDIKIRLGRAVELYEQDKIFQAERIIVEIASFLQAHEPTGDEEVRKAMLSMLEEVPYKIKLEAQEVKKMIQEMQNDAGWNLISSNKDLRTFYRSEPPNPCHALKMTGVVNSPLFNLVALVNEVDLYVKWIPWLKTARQVAGSQLRKAVYLLFDLPWPFSPRDAFLYGYCVDNLDNGNVFIFIRSYAEGDLPLDRQPAIAPGGVRVDVYLAGMLLTPLDESSTQVTMIANVDPKLDYVPYGIINLVRESVGSIGVPVRTLMCGQMFAAVAKTVFQSEYEARIAEDKNGFYSTIRRRLALFSRNKSEPCQ